MTEFRFDYLLNAAAYSISGMLLFGVAFAALSRMIPCDLWKEIRDNQNMAVAVIAGAMSIGLCIIIAAAVH